MDENLSLDEIIELRRKSNPNFARGVSNKPTNSVDYRNRYYQGTHRKRKDSANTYHRKWRPSSSSSSSPPVKPARSISWQPNYGRNRYLPPMNTGFLHRPFNPSLKKHRGYVDLDNMQDMEDEEIICALEVGCKRKKPSSPIVTINLDTDDESEMSNAPRSTPPKKTKSNDLDHGPRKILASVVKQIHDKEDHRGMSMNKLGFRILVSNLDPYVTTSDIREVFSQIGTLYEAKVIRPGTAEVVFKSLEDARAAVKEYHRRELDGQPMHCVLINVEPPVVKVDVDVLHSVLFGNQKESRPLFSGKHKNRK
nr:polymerase delta-interacting protein 3-like [Drosophila kikkawai]